MFLGQGQSHSVCAVCLGQELDGAIVGSQQQSSVEGQHRHAGQHALERVWPQFDATEHRLWDNTGQNNVTSLQHSKHQANNYGGGWSGELYCSTASPQPPPWTCTTSAWHYGILAGDGWGEGGVQERKTLSQYSESTTHTRTHARTHTHTHTQRKAHETSLEPVR